MDTGRILWLYLRNEELTVIGKVNLACYTLYLPHSRFALLYWLHELLSHFKICSAQDSRQQRHPPNHKLFQAPLQSCSPIESSFS
jgi:hypothetical protein